jgi:hypothetical protein
LRSAQTPGGKERTRRNAIDAYTERRAFTDSIKSVPCADCGGTFDPICMDFDHRPGEVKLFSIGNRLSSRGFESIRAEISKCDIVCANCHRIRTHRKRNHRHSRRDVVATNQTTIAVQLDLLTAQPKDKE